jgi:hypothetical protein
MRKSKVSQIIGLIGDLHGDMSVPDTRTLEELEEIQSDIEGKIEGLREQIKNREEDR